MLLCTARSPPPEGLFVGAIWPSLTTGVSPARRGVHSWEQLKSGTYEFFCNITPHFMKRAPFWNALSDAGKRVAISALRDLHNGSAALS